MQYAIIIFTFTAIVSCQVHEFISPDTDITEVKNIEDLDILTRANKNNARVVYDNYYSQEIASLEIPAIKTARNKKKSAVRVHNKSLKPSMRAGFYDIKTIGGDSYDLYETEHIEVPDIRTTTTKVIVPRINHYDSLSSFRDMINKDIVDSRRPLEPLQVNHGKPKEITISVKVNDKSLPSLRMRFNENMKTIENGNYYSHETGNTEVPDPQSFSPKVSKPSIKKYDSLPLSRELKSKDFSVDSMPPLEPLQPIHRMTKEITSSVKLNDTSFSFLRMNSGEDMKAIDNTHYDLHETRDVKVPDTTANTVTMPRIKNYDPLSSLREFESKDFALDSMPLLEPLHPVHRNTEEITPSVKLNDTSLPSLGINDNEGNKTVSSNYNLHETGDIEINDSQKSSTKIPLKELISKDTDVQFDEIKNGGTNTSKPGISLDRVLTSDSVMESKFLKVDNKANGELKFSLVKNMSDISKSNPRKVFFARPIVKNGSDLLSLKGKENQRLSSDENDDYRPKDFSKSTFVGVPMNKLLQILRAKTNEGYNETAIGNYLRPPADLANGVVGFIKSSARNIGDIVFNGR